MDFRASSEDISEEPKTIHVLELVKDEFDVLHRVVGDQLKGHGVTTALKRRDSRSKTRKSGSTPGTPASTNNSNELVRVTLKPHNVPITIPKYLKIMIDYIKNYIDEEGLFRRAGACARISNLISGLNDTDQISDANVFDVCTAMKQLLRRCDDPLIPFNLHHIFLKCLELPQQQRSDSMVLAVFLLPKDHIHILFYLMEFLYEVTQHSDKNKMDAKNLAIVLAPNIMPFTAIPTKCGKDFDAKSSTDFFHKHVEIVKILIEMGDRIGIASHNLASALVTALCKHSEDELESEGEGRKRKRRSSSLNRVFDFLRKKKLTRNAETPGSCSTTPFTPGIHTPVIIPRSRKGRSAAATPISTRTKNRILSAMQKKGLPPPFNATPNHGVVYPSPGPGICLNPRPAVTEAPTSVQISRLPKSRMNRSMLKNYESSTAIESGSLDRTKSGLSILPLAKSPRSRMPLCVTPSVADLNSFAHEAPSSSSVKEGLDEEDNAIELLRLTPMLREINVLTLAALDEGPTPESIKPKPKSKRDSEMLEHNERKTPESCDVQPMETNNAAADETSNTRTSRSKFKAEARRCQSFNEASRARNRRGIPRRKTDGTLRMRRGKAASISQSPLSLRPRKNPQSASDLNRSPNRCTLRRGRPNTMRAGLLRPSPTSAHAQVQTVANETPPGSTDVNPTNFVLDRKGRVSRRMNSRPALILPRIENQGDTPQEQKIMKPPRGSVKFVSKLQSPKKVSDGKLPSPSDVPPLSYVASKLKREADGTINMLIKNMAESPKTPFNNRKGRSCSMRNDMIRTPSLTPRKELADENVKNVPVGRSMRRGLSVQELVKKFDNCIEEPVTGAFYSLRRDDNGKIPRPDFTNRRNIMATKRGVPPPKPPRTSLTENASNKRSLIKQVSTTAQFTRLTRSISTTTNTGIGIGGRGSKQVLKNNNLL